MIIKKRLAALLFNQSWSDTLEHGRPFEQIPEGLKELHLKQADQIIELFVDAIKNGEFEVPKHYHEKINSAFVFPPCKSFKGEFKA